MDMPADETRQYGFTRPTDASSLTGAPDEVEAQEPIPRELDADGLPAQPEDPWVYVPRLPEQRETVSAAPPLVMREESASTFAVPALPDDRSPEFDSKRLRSNTRRPPRHVELTRPDHPASVTQERTITGARQSAAAQRAFGPEAAAPQVGPTPGSSPASEPPRMHVIEPPTAPVKALQLRSAVLRERENAYIFLRVLTGLNFFGHGYARIFTGSFLGGFAQHMQQQMAHAPLDPRLVLATGYTVPWVELLIGVLLLSGLWVRWALYLAFVLLMVLMFGVTMAQNWSVAGDQLIYGLVLAALLYGQASYDVSWWRMLRRR